MAEKSEGEELEPDRRTIQRLDDCLRNIAKKNSLECMRLRWVLFRRNKIAVCLGEPQKTLDDFLVPAARRRS